MEDHALNHWGKSLQPYRNCCGPGKMLLTGLGTARRSSTGPGRGGIPVVHCHKPHYAAGVNLPQISTHNTQIPASVIRSKLYQTLFGSK